MQHAIVSGELTHNFVCSPDPSTPLCKQTCSTHLNRAEQAGARVFDAIGNRVWTHASTHVFNVSFTTPHTNLQDAHLDMAAQRVLPALWEGTRLGVAATHSRDQDVLSVPPPVQHWTKDPGPCLTAVVGFVGGARGLFACHVQACN